MTIRLETLPNGLRIATQRMDTVETVSLGVWVHVGTRHEAAEVNGVSHLLEHMAFKGTARRSARQIAEEIEAVGGYLNAYTSREITAYTATILKDDVALAVDIIADILQNSVFDETELARERSVVLQEIGQAEDTPDDIVFDHFQKAAFRDQPMGRPVLGPAEIIGAMPRAALVDYMGRHYAPPRMVISAAGNLDHHGFVDVVARAFDHLPPGGRGDAVPASYGGGEEREERELEQAHLVLGFEGFSYADPDYYAQSVYSTILGGGMSSRLFQEIRENRGLVYSIYSFNSSYEDSGLFGVYAGTGPDQLPELVPVLCEEIRGTLAGVTDDEMKRARAQLRAGILMSLESTSSRAEQIARQIIFFGRPIPIDEISARIMAVDGASVRRVAERILTKKPTLAAVGPLERLDPLPAIAARLRA
ncbi:MAG: insulinase family protein [Alphaproteobacteria bacterium]|nr:insulinase family protein [Alphaproteobacteria bacterium]